MDTLTILQFAAGGLGLLSVGMMTTLPKYIIPSLYIHAVSCVLMGAYTFIMGQPGIYLSQLGYLIFDVVGIIMWTRHNTNLKHKLEEALEDLQ